MTWWKTAKPGDKVVCIDDSPVTERGVWTKYLCIGEVYEIETVRATCFRYDGILQPYPISFDLVGIKRRAAPFNAARFKPVEHRKTDISIFTSMLTKTRIENLRELDSVQ